MSLFIVGKVRKIAQNVVEIEGQFDMHSVFFTDQQIIENYPSIVKKYLDTDNVYPVFLRDGRLNFNI